MKSIALFTDEMDDLEKAVRELRDEFADFTLQKNSVGLVFAEQDTEFPELVERLTETFNIPLIGCSAMGMFTKHGFKQDGISLHIMTSDDCEFLVGTTGEITVENAKEKIRETYQQISANKEQPNLIFTYGSLPDGLNGDDFIEIMDDLCEGVPIYGGIASDFFVMTNCCVLNNERVIKNGISMLLISGMVRPLLQYQFTVANSLDYEGIATETEDDILKTLNNVTVKDTLSSMEIATSSADLAGAYANMPFKISYVDKKGNEVEVMRQLASVDEKNGYGKFLGKIPQGAKVRISIVGREDIHDSVALVAKNAMRHFLQEKGYRYSTLIVTSCAARMLNYSTDISAEANKYIGMVPPNISVSGYYAYGEFCPIKAQNTGKLVNVFHNATFSLLLM